MARTQWILPEVCGGLAAAEGKGHFSFASREPLWPSSGPVLWLFHVRTSECEWMTFSRLSSSPLSGLERVVVVVGRSKLCLQEGIILLGRIFTRFLPVDRWLPCELSLKKIKWFCVILFSFTERLICYRFSPFSEAKGRHTAVVTSSTPPFAI